MEALLAFGLSHVHRLTSLEPPYPLGVLGIQEQKPTRHLDRQVLRVRDEPLGGGGD